jgi:hypothetical protein
MKGLGKMSLKELWNRLIRLNPTNNDLRFIVSHVGPLKQEAAQILIKRNPSNDELTSIIFAVPSLREKAASMLLKHNPSDADLQCIIFNVSSPSLKKEAIKILRQKNRKIISSIITKILNGVEAGDW